MNLLKHKKNSGPKLPKVIEHFFGSNRVLDEEYTSNVPAVNISVDDKMFDISLLVPGINKKDLKVEIDKNQLIINCKKEFKKEKKKKDYFRKV